MSNMLVKGHCV